MRPRVTSRKCRGSHAGPCWVYLVVRPRMSPRRVRLKRHEQGGVAIVNTNQERAGNHVYSRAFSRQ
jgi:hypothetical protein